MNNPCAVCRDLMPLYAESMASEASAAIVEEHLAGCPPCRGYLAEIKQSVCDVKDTDASVLRQIKKRLQRGKTLTVLVTLMLTLVVLITAIAYLTAPDYFPYSDELVSVRELDDDTVMVIFDEAVAGYDLSIVTNKDTTAKEYSLTAWNTTWNRWFPRRRSSLITLLNTDRENGAAVFYYQANGQDDILMYNRGVVSSEAKVTLPRLVLNYYFLLAIGLLIISGIAWVIFREKPQIGTVLSRIMFLPVAYLVSHLVIKGFNATTYNAYRDFITILLAMIPLYFALFVTQTIIRSKRKLKPQARP